MRCGDTSTRLAASFGIGFATAFRYIREALDVLAVLAPTLAKAIETIRTKAFVILDGTLLPINRIAAYTSYYSSKHKRHGMNVQVLTDPFGRVSRRWRTRPSVGAFRREPRIRPPVLLRHLSKHRFTHRLETRRWDGRFVNAEATVQHRSTPQKIAFDIPHLSPRAAADPNKSHFAVEAGPTSSGGRPTS